MKAKREHARVPMMTLAGVVSMLVLGCPPAKAHLVTTGLGPFYDGIGHLLLSPADSVCVIALTLLAAMRGTRFGRMILALLPSAWLAGGIAGLSWPIAINAGWITGVSFLMVGAMVAADRALPLASTATLVGVIGLAEGLLNGSALARTSSGPLELVGSIAALTVIVSLIGGLVVSIRVFWARIVVRVMGSWIAATGLLMLGWTLRGAS